MSDATIPVIVSAVRTPIGKYLGGLSPLPAPRLGEEQCWHLADVERAGDTVVHPWVTKLGQTPTVDADRNDLEAKLGLEVP